MKLIVLLASAMIGAQALAGSAPGDFIVKMKPGRSPVSLQQSFYSFDGGEAEDLGDSWFHVSVPVAQNGSVSTASIVNTLRLNPDIEYIQPNYRLQLVEDYQVHDPAFRKVLEALDRGEPVAQMMPQDIFGMTGLFSEREMSSGGGWFSRGKPETPAASITPEFGPDPLLKYQWGMKAINADAAWKVTTGDKNLIVAVIDSGVDYNHPDLVGNIWHNPNEIGGNQIDDDKNGYVDDTIGWDFADNDNKPFDVTGGIVTTLLVGGNPGHGTHCAGNIGAVGNNSIGISGVAPNVSIMPLRFIDKMGKGTSAQAIKAINYAVKNGAKILSNSWGSEGDDPKENNMALREAIDNARKHDVLFVAAAGNGHSGIGYDNDTDKRPAMPASYKIDNIVSVAAVDKEGHLGKFSNWGKKSVHVAAPGVAVYSTMVKGRYSDSLVNFFGFKIGWDGTSMAAPHVAGAAALIWSAHPEYTYSDVKARLISATDHSATLGDKVVSGGLLNLGTAIR